MLRWTRQPDQLRARSIMTWPKHCAHHFIVCVNRFEASFDTHGSTEETLSLDWIEAGDYVCHRNGICDKLFTMQKPWMCRCTSGSVTIHTIATPWSAFISTTPSAVFYRDNVREYAVKPWHNVKVVVEEEPPDPIEDGTHIVHGTGRLIGRTNRAVDSTYTYRSCYTIRK